jgi:hypothetical protein
MGQTFSNEQTGQVKGIERWEIRDRAQGARHSILAATRDCLAGVAGDTFPADAFSNDLCTAQLPCREIRRVVTEYAHILGALGHGSGSATELALQAVCEGAGQEDPPTALLDAVRAWSREAF